MSETPTAAFVLGLIAGIFGLIFGIAVAVVAAVGGIGVSLVGSLAGLGWLGGAVIAIGMWWTIASIIIIVGSLEINSGIPNKVRTGGILVLIFSILSFPNWLTLILGIIGGALALAWKAPPQAPQSFQQEVKGP